MRVLDLASGIGGLSAGFALAAAGDVWTPRRNTFTGVDRDEKALEAYRENLSAVAEVKTVRADITETIPRGEYEAVISGPPCKPFSTNTPRRIAGRKHPDYPVFQAVIEAIETLQPEMFLIENVPGILRHQYALEEAKRKLKNYTVTVAKIPMQKLGLPQRRIRVFIFGAKKWDKVEWYRELMKNSEKPPITAEFIADLEPEEHTWMRAPELTEREIKHALDRKYYTETWKPSNTIRAHGEHLLIDGEEVRPIRVREALRIQGAPDWMNPPKTTPRQALKHTGNMVPPMIAYKVAYHIIMEKNRKNEEEWLPALPDAYYLSNGKRREWSWLDRASARGSTMARHWWPTKLVKNTLDWY